MRLGLLVALQPWVMADTDEPVTDDDGMALLSATGDPEREHFVSIKLDAKDWAIRFRGWFWPRELRVATEGTNSGLVLVLEREPDKSDLDALYISGTVEPASEQLPALIRDFFTVDLPAGANAFRLGPPTG